MLKFSVLTHTAKIAPLIGMLALVTLAPVLRAAELAGAVRDGQGRPIAGAVVEVRTVSGEFVGDAATSALGGFSFSGLDDGDYALIVRAAGFQTWESNTVSPNTEISVDLELEVLRDSVSVTATRSELPVTALPSTATLLDKEMIDQQRAVADDLASVLEKTTPGYAPGLRKMTGRAETLRGRNPLYLINGVPQHNSLRDGSRDGYTIDLDFVEQVEIVHGSNSLQGIGATGGVVNMVTKAPPADGRWRQDLRLALSTHDSFDGDGFAPKASYFLGKRVGLFDLSGGFSATKRDLFFDAQSNPIGLYPTQGDIMDSGQRNYYFRAGFEPTSTQRLGVTFNDFKLQRDGKYVVVLGDRSTGLLTSTAPGDPRPVVGDPAKNDVTTVSVDYRNQDLANGDLSIHSFYNNYAALFEGGVFGGSFRLTPDGEPFLDQSQIESRKHGVKVTYSIPETGLPGFTPRFGVDYFNDESAQVLARSNRDWVPPTTLRSWAPFLQLEQTFGTRVTLTGGVRLESANVAVDDYTTIARYGLQSVAGGSPSFREVLPNAGALVRLGGGFSAFGSYSEGFTMPDVGRVLRAIDVPGVDVDDLLDIKPVVTNNTEGGLRFRANRGRFEASYFQSDSALGSRLIADPDGIFNVGRQRTEIDGVEVSAEIRPHDRIILGGNYAWLRGRLDSNGDEAVDSDLDGVNIAPNRVNGFVQLFATSRLNARFQVSSLFDRNFDGPGAPSNANFSGYTTADLMLGFETELGRIRIGVENIFDKQYMTYFSQTEPVQRNDTMFAGLGRTFTFVFEPNLSNWLR